MKFLRLLLLPFSLLYGIAVVIRNWCYDAGIFKSFKADVPVISVGNLDVGGAGKSPMTEYLIRLFKDQQKLATLSRGYGRATKGFLKAQKPTITADTIGDEPAQFAHKFPDVTVAVCEDRAFGLQQLQREHNLIILDDAYQHRAVTPGFSILLFDYTRINEPRLLLPAGNLREPFSGRKRADVIVISKCPAQLPLPEQDQLTQKIKPYPHQQVFFTSINYLPLQQLDGKATARTITPDTTVFVLTGIANPVPLLQHLKTLSPHIIHHNYPDHHRFSLKNISKLADEFSNCKTENKLLITTEKDAQRLDEPGLQQMVKQLPFLVLPIGITFLNNKGAEFDNLVKKYVTEHTQHHQLH